MLIVPFTRVTVADVSPLIQLVLVSPRVQMASPLAPVAGVIPEQVVLRLSSMFQILRCAGLEAGT